VTVFISVTYCFWYTVFVPHEAAQPPQSPLLTTALPSQPPSQPPAQAPQSAAHVLVHMATTAKAGSRQERTLRITQTSRKKKKQKEDRAVFFKRARTSVDRRTHALPTTETIGRLIRWIDYVD
jgi:hypothetical protein